LFRAVLSTFVRLSSPKLPTLSGNWRVTFTFVGKDADQVDYEDYH
jgi:hypothetical protein